jgi:hypothetical protein
MTYLKLANRWVLPLAVGIASGLVSSHLENRRNGLRENIRCFGPRTRTLRGRGILEPWS